MATLFFKLSEVQMSQIPANQDKMLCISQECGSILHAHVLQHKCKLTFLQEVTGFCEMLCLKDCMQFSCSVGIEKQSPKALHVAGYSLRDSLSIIPWSVAWRRQKNLFHTFVRRRGWKKSECLFSPSFLT